MQEFLKKVFDTIERYRMISPGDHVLVGVSGGADSVCLLHCLLAYQKRCDFSVSVMHIEHGLRGAESLQDAAFVEELCARLHIPCNVVHGDVKELAKQEKESIEEAARHFRYRTFAAFCEKQGAKLAVAHHQGDQAETVLHNLVRGSALTGLSGMLPVREGTIRPLLFVTREEIETYLNNIEEKWCTDQTNLDTVYTRNKLRHLVLPQLNEINPQAMQHIAAAAGQIAQADAFLKKLAAAFCTAHMKQEADGVSVMIAPLLQEDAIIRSYIIRKMIETVPGSGLKDVGAVHLDAIAHLLEAEGKHLDLPGNLVAEKAYGKLTVRQKTILNEENIRSGKDASDLPQEVMIDTEKLQGGESLEAVFGEDHFTFRLFDKAELLAQGTDFTAENKYTKYLAYDIIKQSLAIRTRQQGDYLIVDEAGHKKRLKNYMIDRKIPADIRTSIPLLAKEDHVLWIAGYRISEKAKITAETRQVLQIIWVEGE